MKEAQAWTHGLLAGAGLGLAPYLGLGFAPLLLLVLLATASLVVGVLAWAAIDLKRHRRSADWRVTAVVLAAAGGVVVIAVATYLFGVELVDGDVFYQLFPPAVLFLAADRFAARGDLAWRDRSLAAACGFLAIWPFLIDAQLPAIVLSLGSGLPLLVLLLVRLPGSARVVLAALAGLSALSLGVYVDGTVARRALEWSAFVGYALLTLLAWRRDRGARPSAPTHNDKTPA